MRVAWSQVGSHAGAQKGSQSLGSTRHLLDAVWSFAWACKEMFGGFCNRRTSQLAQRTKSVVITKHHDATPATLSFGNMSDELYPHAKYLMKDTSSTTKWKLVDFATFHAKNPSWKPERGVLQLFAQSATLCWMENRGEGVQKERVVTTEIHCMPKILQRGNASAIFNAVEGSHAPLPLPEIKHLANDMEFILVSEVPDNCSANVLKKAKTIMEYEDLDNVFYFQDACLVHKLNSILRHATAEHDLIGHLYAVACIANTPRYRAHLLKTLKAVVQEDMGEFYCLGVYPPSVAWVDDMESILCKTLLRTDRVAGGESPQEVNANNVPLARRDTVEKLKQFCNGNPNADRVAHYCTEACGCGSKEVAAEKVFATIVEAKLVGPFHVPAKNRWGSASLTLAQVAAGTMIHGLLPRVFVRAFGGAQADNAEDDDEEDFRAANRRKLAKAMDFFTNKQPQRAMEAAVACWLSEGIHGYWRQVEYLDSRGDALLHVVQRNLVAPLLHDMTTSLTHTTEQWARPLHGRFAKDFVGQAALCTTIRNMTSEILAHLHTRIVLHFEQPQFQLLDLLATSQTREQKQKIIDDFMAYDDCCLNPEFSRKIKHYFEASHASMLDNDEFLSMLRMWSKSTHVTNMHIEREFASSKKSCTQRVPAVRRFIATMYLGKLLRIHKAAGGVDSKYGPSRKTLVTRGLIKAGQNARSKSNRYKICNPKRESGLFNFMKSRCPKGLSKTARNIKLKELAAEFRRLPLAARRCWVTDRAGLAEVADHSSTSDVNHYSIQIADRLWGCSDENHVITEHAMQTFLRDTWGVHDFSLRQVCGKADKAADLFARDEGQVKPSMSSMTNLDYPSCFDLSWFSSQTAVC